MPICKSSVTKLGERLIRNEDPPDEQYVTWDLTTQSLPTGPLYVEGFGASGAERDVELTLAWDKAPADDKVKITVVDVQLTECDSDWVPKGGEEDNTTTFTATIYPSNLEGILRFTLPSADVSDYPGYCTNAGDETDDEKDLQFPAQTGYTISGPYDSIATKDAAANNATVTVKSFDYGSAGTIMAEAQIGGAWFAANVAGATTKKATVPKDTDKDGLADKWENDMRAAWQTQYGQAPDPDTLAFFDKTSDKEDKNPDGNGDIPAHATHKDGLEALEEYRGYKGIDPTDATKVVRLSPARKELLIEVDIMKASTKTPPGGATANSWADAQDGTTSTLLDLNAEWTQNELVELKLRPDTTKDRYYTIKSNVLTGVTVVGRISEATDNQTPKYSFTKWVPPTVAQAKTMMGNVGTAFWKAGIKVYYVIDDTDSNRVNYALYDVATGPGWTNWVTWMNGCRDDAQANEQDYRKFVHLAFVDIFMDLPMGGVTHPDLKGSLVATFGAQEGAKNYSSVTWIQAAGSVATHEVGHSVKCDHPTDAEVKENAFSIQYTGNADAAKFSAPGDRAFGFTQNAAIKCDLTNPSNGSQSFERDPRTTDYDTMQEVVNYIDGLNKYAATLSNPPNKPNKHPFMIVTHVAGEGHSPNTANITAQDIKTAEYQVKALKDEYLMCPRWGPGALNLDFSRTWTKSIIAMDVIGHYGMPQE